MLDRFTSNLSARLRRMSSPSKAAISTSVVTAMVVWTSGAQAAVNVSTLLNNLSNTVVGALAGNTSTNTTGLLQTQIGGGSQAAGNASVADADLAGVVNADATNNNAVAQLTAGPGPINQDITGSMIAGTVLGLGINVDATNLTGIVQTAIGGPAHNQMVDNGVLADADVATAIDVDTSNTLAAVQATGASNVNQMVVPTMVAGSLVDDTQVADANNLTTILQTVVGGSANQALVNGAAAVTNIFTGQMINTFNVLTLLQVCGSNCNQNAAVTMAALTDADQTVVGTSDNVNVLAQTAVGSGPFNQALNNGSLAGVLAGATQEIATGNVVGILQIGGGVQTNQDAPVIALAGTEADQLVAADAGNLNVGLQTAIGGSAFNQQLDNGSFAGAGVGAAQEILTGNQVGIAQVQGGGQGNQSAPVIVGAFADATQVAVGMADNTNLLAQTAVGVPGAQFNQDMDNGTAAITGVLAGQALLTGNSVGISQIGGAGQGNQSAPVIAGADADATQFVTGIAANGNDLTQTAVGGAAGSQANQDMENGSLATSIVGAGQALVTGNDIDVAQVSAGGQGNQSAPILANADSDATQFIIAGAVNGNDLTQTSVGAGNQTNQDMDNGTAAINTVLAGQIVDTGNDIDVAQVSAGGQGNQSAPILANADSDATQFIVSGAGNLNVLDQTAVGGAGHQGNQDIDNGSIAADAVLAEQDVDSENSINVAQIHAAGQGSQNLVVDADADANAVQGIVTGAGNINLIGQTDVGGAGGQTNQDVDNLAAAATGVEAAQDVDAVNNVTAAQTGVATTGALSQNGSITPTATVNAGQGIVAGSDNLNLIGQTAGGTGQSNQDVDNGTAAVTGVAANQDADAVNNVALGQTAVLNTGAAAQSAVIAPTATVNAGQDVDAGSSNTNVIGQDASGASQANQDVDNGSLAATGVDANQDADAVNNVLVTQTEVINTGAGAQFVQVTPTATVNADQDVDADSSNTNLITQDPTGPANQNVDNGTVADTGVAANQDADAVNNVVVVQTGVANNGALAQAANIAPTATTNASQDADADASNTTGIAQEGTTGNQNATNGTAAGTDLDANQTAGSENNVLAVMNCNVTNGACAQYIDTAPTSTTTAGQNVDANSENNTGIAQEQTGGTAGNQNAENGTVAGTTVGADQEATSGNDEVTILTCTVTGGACAQYTGSMNTADTTAEQNVSGDSANNTGIVQDAANGGNQDALNAAGAATVIDADQDASSQNDATTLQTSLGGGMGSQSATQENTADTDASQTVTGTSENNTLLGQFNIGGGNQNAVNTAAALTNLGVTQNADSTNNSTIGQISTGGGSQTADSTNTATTTSNLDVNAGSSNNTAIIQSN